MQLKQKLVWTLTLMAILPLLIVLFQVVSKLEDDIQERTSEESFNTLLKMSREIKTEMGNQQSIADGLAKVPIVKAFSQVVEVDKDNLYDRRATELAIFFLNYQSTVPSIQALRFTDLSGKTLVKIKEGKLLSGKFKTSTGKQYVENIKAKAFFSWALKSKHRISISDFERGQVTGEVDFCPSMIRYSVPIRDELDILQGLLIVNMWGKRVDDAVEAALGGFSASAYIVEMSQEKHRDGIYLYHKKTEMRFANQVGSDYRFSNRIGVKNWNKIKLGKPNGVFRSKHGQSFFYQKHSPFKSRNTQWLLVIEMSKTQILGPVSKLRDSISILILLWIIVSIFIAHWIGQKLAKPIQELAKLMTRYADGEKQLRYIQNRNDEIESVGSAFNYLSDHIEESERQREKAESAVRHSERLAAIGQMAAGIGHEINNPLMNINSLAELIEQAIPNEDRQTQTDLSTLQKEVKRCASIVQGILNFARETEPCFSEFDIVSLMSESLALFRHRLKLASIKVDFVKASSIYLKGDSKQLQQVLVNVLLNAIQASKNDSNIQVRISESDKNVEILILDEGCGISKQALNQLFNPFYSTKAEGEGTGLGLSVSYGIIKKHNGSIHIENRDEDGAMVKIVLPKYLQDTALGVDKIV